MAERPEAKGQNGDDPTEIALRLRETKAELKEVEAQLALKRATHRFQVDSAILTVLIAGLLAVLGSLGTTYLQNRNAAILAEKEFRSNLILRAVQADDPAIARKNLESFIEMGLLDDPDGKISQGVQRNQFPVLPPQGNQSMDLMANGSFESDSVWISEPFSLPLAYVASPDHPVFGGLRSVLVGASVDHSPIAGLSSVVQKVTIPATARRALLSMWIYPDGTNDASVSHGADYQSVALLNEQGAVLAVLWKTASVDRVWKNLVFDLGGLAGQTVQIAILVNNDSTNAESLWLYADDVHLWVSN